jgi:hypothetical protein
MRGLLAVAALLGAMGFAAAPALAQTAAPQTLSGRVAEVFGNRLVIDLGDERVLAEPADPAASLSARPGDLVRVEGERRGPLVSWRAVSVTASGAPAAGAARPAGPPDNSDGALLGIVERLGLKAIDPPLRKRHHIEVLAQTAEGRKLYVSFDREGRLWEIEDAAYDRDRVVPRNLSRSDYARLAREAGFTPTGEIEERRRHVELEARNRAGEALTLHIDRAGVIYKQVWQR